MTLSTTEKLYYQLHHCSNLLQRIHHSPTNVLKGKELHRGQGRTLRLLNQNDGISQHSLADLLDIRPSSMAELLTKLESSNLLERRQDETDRRVSNVFITENGRQLVEEIEQYRNKRAADLFAGVSAEDQTALAGLLDKLIEALQVNAKAYIDDKPDQVRRSHHKPHREPKRPK